MAYDCLEVISGCVAIILLLYCYLTWTFDFWKSRGVIGPKPKILFGNLKDVTCGKTSLSLYLKDLYHKYKDEPLIGVFQGREPLLLIRDPDLIKDILIKDFTKFSDRAITPNEKVEPFSSHLFRLEATRWRPLRIRLSPTFTSGKLKEMFYLLLECSEHFERFLETLVAKGEPIECREVAAKFTTDVIGSCAFGIEMKALAENQCEFLKMGREIFDVDFKTNVLNKLKPIPFLYQHLGPFFTKPELFEFFTRIMKEMIEYRIKNNVRRQDFVDSLIELKQHPEKLGLQEVDDVYLTAQAFVFFAAGFETSSLTIANAMFELALNSSLQEKLRKEIQQTLEENNDELTFQSIKEMKYLHAFFQETLRKYPPLMHLDRTAQESYTFEGTNITIPKGQKVFIPVYGIHTDTNFYPDPDVFNPERFFDEKQSKSRHPMSYLPFGNGPRNCIGARFAFYQTKMALIKTLLKYQINTCEKTVIPYVIDKNPAFFLQPDHGVYIRLTKLHEE